MWTVPVWRTPAIAAALAACLLASPAGADQDAARPPDLRPGGVCGRVVDAATGKPVPGATVAIADAKGKIQAWTRTDSDGRYLIVTDPVRALRLQPERHGGLFASVARGLGQVVSLPFKVAGAAIRVVQQVSPGAAIQAAALSAVTASPVPVTAEVAGQVARATESDAQRRARETGEQAGKAAVETVLKGGKTDPPKPQAVVLQPAQAIVVVSATGYKDAGGGATAIWVDAPEGEGSAAVGPRAWLQTVKLAPSAGAARSEIVGESVLLADARVEPSLVPAGGKVRVTVKVTKPDAPPMQIRVFAREERKHTVAELQAGADGVYSGELPIDARAPAGPTVVTISALRDEPLGARLDRKKPDPLPQFVARLDDLDPDKPYRYDPLVFAGTNRLEAKITVLSPKQETPVAR